MFNMDEVLNNIREDPSYYWKLNKDQQADYTIALTTLDAYDEPTLTTDIYDRICPTLAEDGEFMKKVISKYVNYYASCTEFIRSWPSIVEIALLSNPKLYDYLPSCHTHNSVLIIKMLVAHPWSYELLPLDLQYDEEIIRKVLQDNEQLSKYLPADVFEMINEL
jgi:hypothetical protein